MSVKQYIDGKHFVLLTKEEHIKLHRDALAYSLGQYKGAIVHGSFTLTSPYSGHIFNQLYWIAKWAVRAKKFNEPIKVQFT